jgi:hypothetical protein
VVRARLPVRTMTLPGAPAAPTRAQLGEPAGPGPSATPTRGGGGSRTVGRGIPAPPDAFRDSWRERTSEYILAGGGGQGGDARRGPHERGLIRGGQVGLAGHSDRALEGPNEMFPDPNDVRWGPFETLEPTQSGRKKPPKTPPGGGVSGGREGGETEGSRARPSGRRTRGGSGGGGSGGRNLAAEYSLAAVSGDSALELEHTPVQYP